jgi:hypothetical protein
MLSAFTTGSEQKHPCTKAVAAVVRLAEVYYLFAELLNSFCLQYYYMLLLTTLRIITRLLNLSIIVIYDFRSLKLRKNSNATRLSC